MYNVNKNTCILYVPMDYIDLYQTKAVWCDFLNIVGMATDLQFEEQLVQVSYLKQDSTLHYMEVQNWQIPHAPRIEGFGRRYRAARRLYRQPADFCACGLYQSRQPR